MSPSNVILYSTTFAATLKIRSDITKIKHILDSKKIPYDDVDLSEQPHRRVDMLKYSDNNHTLPQLHVNNRFIGSADDIQELEDWGELEAILRGVSPGKLAAESAAAAQAEALAYQASLAAATTTATATTTISPPLSPLVLPQPSFSPPSSPPSPEIAEKEEEVHEEHSLEEEGEELKNQQQAEKDDTVEEKNKIENESENLEDEPSSPTSLPLSPLEERESEQPEEAIAAEESCYFSPVILKSNSQTSENAQGFTTKGTHLHPHHPGGITGNCSLEPEFAVVQANLQQLDLANSPSQLHNNGASPPSPISSITPSPSPSPYKLESLESPYKQEEGIEDELSDLERVLEINVVPREKKSPSASQGDEGTQLEAHPLGAAVHAHAVPLLDPLGPSTTEGEEHFAIYNSTSAVTSPVFTLEDEEEQD